MTKRTADRVMVILSIEDLSTVQDRTEFWFYKGLIAIAEVDTLYYIQTILIGGAMAKTKIRQQLLVLYAHSPDLHSQAVAWSFYDGTIQGRSSSGDSEKPPYASVVAAMQDGWRVVQFPQQYPAYPGMEYNTSYLKYEYILEKMEELDG